MGEKSRGTAGSATRLAARKRKRAWGRASGARASGRAVPAVEVGHEMGALTVRGGQLASRDQPAAQQTLFILAVQHDDLHDQILVLPQQGGDLRVQCSFGGIQALPVEAMRAQTIDGLIEARQ